MFHYLNSRHNAYVLKEHLSKFPTQVTKLKSDTCSESYKHSKLENDVILPKNDLNKKFFNKSQNYFTQP